MKKTYAVIGGVAAGSAAAARLKRLQPQAEVILFEKSDHISYRICEFPYLISQSGSENFSVYNPESFQQEKNVQVISGAEVIHINPVKKELQWRNVNTRMVLPQEFTSVLIATGGEARRIPPVSAINYFTIRRPDDLIRAQNYLHNEKPRKAVIIGGGAIGIELAETLAQSGMTVVIADQSPFLLNGQIPAEYSEQLAMILQKAGIQILTGFSVSDGKIAGGKLLSIISSDGYQLTGDVFFSAAGVQPSPIIPGLDKVRTVRGFYQVDRRMETNLRGIFAAGDGAIVKNYRKELSNHQFLATRAHYMGRLAAESMAGMDQAGPFPVFPFVLKAWDFEIGSVGLVIPDKVTSVHVQVSVKDFPPMKPESQPFRVHLVADRRTGRVIGGAVLGPPSSSGVLNVLSMAIQHGLLVSDIEQLGMAYHPAVSGLVNPLQIAARLLINKLKRNRYHS